MPSPSPVRIRLTALAALCATAFGPADSVAETEPPPIQADEPFARAFSPELAARALDNAALHWIRTKNCAACHTVPPYLMARPALAAVLPAPAEARAFVEDAVAGRRETATTPVDARVSLAVGYAVALAFNDARTSGKLHPAT